MEQAYSLSNCHFGHTQTLVKFKGPTLALPRRIALSFTHERRRKLRCKAKSERHGSTSVKEREGRNLGLGDILGPIGLTLGGSLNKKVLSHPLEMCLSTFTIFTRASLPTVCRKRSQAVFMMSHCLQTKDAEGSVEEQENSRGSSSASKQESATDQQTSNGRGLDLGPIAMSFGSSAEDTRGKSTKAASDKAVKTYQWQVKVLWFSSSVIICMTLQVSNYKEKHPSQDCRAYTA